MEALPVEITARWGASPVRRYRAAIVGCGRIARAHATALNEHPAVELVALCDVSEDGMRAFGQTHGVSPDGQFTAYEDLFDAIRPDIVHICTWPDTHAAVTRAAAQRGIHVYSEKPMALDLQQADEMIAACRDAGVLLGVNHHRRGDSRFIRAKRLIQEGAIGELRALVGDHGGGGRRLMGMSTDLYDLFRYFAGDAAWVSAHVMKERRAAVPADIYEKPHEGLAAGDEVSVQFGFRGGAYAYHNGLGHVDLEIAGTHGRFLFHEGVARKPWPFGAAHAAWFQYPEGDGGRQAQGGPDAWRPLDGLHESELTAPPHAHRRMVDRFLRAVDSRAAGNGDELPLCVGEDGRAALEMALAVYASHFTGRKNSTPARSPTTPACGAPLRTKHVTQPLNILWYCTDQQRWDTIGALGNPHVHTPNLDRLVGEGTAFTHAFCQNPLCTPSRTSFLTGHYPSTLHVNTNGNPYFPPLPPHVRLAPRRFADAGYDTGLVGKLHLTGAYYGREPRTDDGYRYFKYSHAPRDDWKSGHDYADWIRAQGADPAQVLRPRTGTPGGLVAPTGPAPERDNVPPPLHQTTWSTETALEFIADPSRRPDQPWLLSVNPYYPHPPFNPPWEYYRRFDPNSLPGPHFRESDLAFQTRLADAGVGFQSPPRRPEQFEGRELQAAYYAQIELVDHELGRILDALDQSGERERTLIVFHADHGEGLGDHGLTQKGCRFYDGLVRVPLIISLPGTVQTGLVSDALVELTDVLPTLMELCDLPVPPRMHGRSLFPILTAAASPDTHREFVRSEHYDACDLPGPPDGTWATMYRDRRHKLVTYHTHGAPSESLIGELYDMSSDLHEHDSLWDAPAHQALKATLLQRSFEATVRAMDYGPPRITPY